MRRALAFLTPLGGPAEPSPAALAWFPAVGAGLGAAVGGVWWLAARAWAPALAAAVAVVADLVLTGFLHLDGLVDAADGLLPHLDRQRRLAVMAEPTAGAFGVGTGVAVLLVRWAAMATMAPSLPLVSALWCASRTAMAVVATSVPYARPGGLATAFRGGGTGAGVVTLAGGLAVSLALAGLARGLVGVVTVVAALATAAAVVGFGVRRVGGFTGDVLGAAGMVGETTGLLLAAGRW